jgi:hypothetical protein
MSNIARRYADLHPATRVILPAVMKPVTVIQPIVTENTPPVTINQKRGRGRPATGVALSAADRARKYRDRRRGAVAAS